MKYFKKSEFACKCGCGTNKIKKEHTEMMDKARGISGIPYSINSGYRCEKHPLSIKNPTSAHIKGVGSDIRFRNGKELALILGGLGGAGFERFGINFEKKFIHVDSDKDKVSPTIWGY